MNTTDLKSLAGEARLVIDRALDDAVILKGLSEAARAKGIDWTQLKALVKAQAQDARDGGHRIGKLVERADFACAYAAALGGEMNENDKTRSSSEDKTRAAACEFASDAVIKSDPVKPAATPRPREAAPPPVDDLEIPGFLDRRSGEG